MTTETNDRLPATQSPRDLAALSRQRDELDAFSVLTPEEMVLPVMKLVQGVSRFEGASENAGQFYNTLTEEYKSELLVSILATSRSRSLFGDDFNEPPLCASDDSVRPRSIEEIETVTGTVATGPTCATCTFAQWGSAKDGRGKGQACRFSFNLLCIDLNDKSIFIIRVAGVSLDGWRKYATAGRMAGQPAYALETYIGAREETFEAGKAYVLTFKAGTPLEPEVRDAMRQQAANYRDVNLGVEGDPDLPEDAVAPAADDIVTHMSTCATFNGRACDCEVPFEEPAPEPPAQEPAPEAATITPEEIPFETADDFPPNPPMITDAQKDYLIGGGKIKNTDSLCSKWVKHRGGSKPIIEDIEHLDPAIAAGVVFNEKAQILNWRIIILTEEQATAMIDALKKELGIGTRKRKEPAASE